MQRWLYFVKLDERHDLRQFVRVRHNRGGYVDRPSLIDVFGAWGDGRFVSGLEPLAILEGLLCEPTPDESAAWDDAVLTLRSMARRVMGHRPRPTRGGAGVVAIDPREADAIVRRYVGLCRPVIRESAKPLRSFDRMTLEPSIPVTCFGDGAAILWQVVFASMMPGFNTAVCCDCGTRLADSKTGKRSKAERCRGCRFAKFKAQFTDDEWRKRERRKQAAWRANNKGG
jgi:hypothetical protein